MPKVVALVSGGIKSAVAAARFSGDHEIILIHFDYGQVAAMPERAAVEVLADHLPGSKVFPIDMRYVTHLRSLARLGSEPGVGDKGSDAKGGKRKVVDAQSTVSEPPTPVTLRGIAPVFFTVAAHIALQNGAECVVSGLNLEVDDTLLGYQWSDGEEGRRREFLHALGVAVDAALPARSRVLIESPVLDVAYRDIVKLAYQYKLPIDKLCSCERSSPRPCGQCGACKSRSKAFLGANRTDPQTSPFAVSG